MVVQDRGRDKCIRDHGWVGMGEVKGERRRAIWDPLPRCRHHTARVGALCKRDARLQSMPTPCPVGVGVTRIADAIRSHTNADDSLILDPLEARNRRAIVGREQQPLVLDPMGARAA